MLLLRCCCLRIHGSRVNKSPLALHLVRLWPLNYLICRVTAGKWISLSLTILFGNRVGLRLTAEQIFNLRILCEKYLQHQQDLYHVFIDFKKAFDRVWHAALWATMRHFNINANLVRMIQNLYDKATSAVYLNNSIGDWIRTTVGVSKAVCSPPPSSTSYWRELRLTH